MSTDNIDKPSDLLGGMTPHEFALRELYEFQEATGCDTAAEYRDQLARQQAEPAREAVETSESFAQAFANTPSRVKAEIASWPEAMQATAKQTGELRFPSVPAAPAADHE